MVEPFSLYNQVALITGGGTGLGRAIAECMIQTGSQVIITGRREDILAQACRKLGDQARYYVYDVTQTHKAPELARQLEADQCRPTIVVHNAGIHLKKTLAQTSDEEFLTLFQTHVLGACTLTRALLPSMQQQPSGHILFITSMAAVFGIPAVSAYTIAKSGLAGLVRSLATELSPQGIRVNAIAPGWIETDMSTQALDGDSARRNRILDRTPMHALGRPEDIGWAAVYLSSPAARFITGQQLVVDGGISIGF